MSTRTIAALAAAASLGVAGVAYAVEADFGVKVTPSGKKGTKKKPNPIGFGVTVTVNGKGSTPTGSFGVKQVTLHLDKNLRFNPSKFPTCSEATVATDASACPAKSKLGSGAAAATAGTEPGKQIMANPSVVAYNGGANKLLLKVVPKPGEFDSSAVLVGTLKSDTGKFGKKLVVDVPSKLQTPIPNLYATITSFKITIKKQSSKKRGFIESAGCTGGKYKFRGDAIFTDNSKVSIDATAKC